MYSRGRLSLPVRLRSISCTEVLCENEQKKWQSDIQQKEKEASFITYTIIPRSLYS